MRPAARTVLLSKIDEEVQVDGTTYRFGTNERDFHSHIRGTLDWYFGADRDGDDVLIMAHPGAPVLRLASSPTATFSRLDLWYWRFRHRAELERGLDSVKDLNLPFCFPFARMASCLCNPTSAQSPSTSPSSD